MSGVNNEKVRIPILVPFGVAIMTLMIISIAGVYWLQNEYIDRNTRKMVQGVSVLFDELLEKDAEKINGLIDFIKKDEHIQQAFLAKDRQAFLNYATPIFEDIRSKYKVTHFYVHGTDRICFLRVHNPPSHGDQVNRFTMDEVVRQGKPIYGIELGKYGTFTLRVIHPWYIDDKLVGYLELGEEIEHITTSLKKALGSELCFIINKSYLDRSQWETGLKVFGKDGSWDLMSDYVIIDSTLKNVSQELASLLTSVHNEHKDSLFETKIADHQYKSGFFSLIDAGKRDVGDIVVMKDTTQSKASAKRLITLLAVICLLVGTGLLVSLKFYICFVEKKLTVVHNDMQEEVEYRKEAEGMLLLANSEMEIKVQERTAELRNEITERKQKERELQEMHDDLVLASHRAGMAEVATDVLHNVGNILNSVNVSVSIIRNKISDSEAGNIEKVADMITEHVDNLGTFLTEDPRGKHVPVYLAKAAKLMVNEQKEISEHLQSLTKNVEHINDIVRTQQVYAKTGGVHVSTNLNETIKDAIEINNAGLKRHGIQFELELDKLPEVYTDKQRILQILVNLIGNAKYAVSKSGNPEKMLTIRCYQHGEDRFRIEVADNGIGIPQENLIKVFQHGFTTKEDGHGFGLHSGALAAKEMDGSLNVYSDGVGQGATFILELPFKPIGAAECVA